MTITGPRLSSWALKCALLCLAGAVWVGPAAAQAVLRVDGGAPPGGDGSSWAMAFRDLALALETAASLPGPVEIWVAEGSYRPDVGFPNGDIERSFVLSGDLQLLGGFAGDETSAEDRDPLAHETVLSGDLWGNDFPDWLQRDDNSLHIVTAIDLGAPSLIDGFTLLGGNANFDGSELLGGGAIFVERAELAIHRCHFTENSAGTTMPDVGNFGAAVYVKGSGRLTVTDCQFVHNRATNGGAIGVLNRDGGEIDLVVTGTLFADNLVPNQSAGAILFAGRSLVIEGCEFSDNNAGYGGAIRSTSAEEVIIRDSLFARNGADVSTAALFLDRSSNILATPAVIERCRFVDNVSTGGFPDGTIYLLETITHMSHCEVLGNSNLRVNPHTGAIEGAGTITVKFDAGHRFVDCLIADNFAGIAGGVVLSVAQAEFDNCTVAGNRAAAMSGYASGLVVASSILDAENSILWGNRIGTGVADNLPGLGGEGAQISGSNATLAIDHCDIEGWTGGLGGTGNLGADPLFTDAGAQDFRLSEGAPAVDAGENAFVPGDLLVDLDGNPRIVDGDAAEGAVVDMGAYELPPSLVGVDEGPGADGSPLALAVRWEGSGLRVDYALPTAGRIDLAVFDVQGRRLRALGAGPRPAGAHRACWDESDASGRPVASGVYFVRLATGAAVATQRIVLLR